MSSSAYFLAADLRKIREEFLECVEVLIHFNGPKFKNWTTTLDVFKHPKSLLHTSK